MASNTPKKSVCEEIHNHCRCCNNENPRRILLYGDKAKAEGLVETIIRLTELHISENDNLSKWICRNCAGKIQTLAKNLDEFKTLCKDTVQKQQKELASARMKRGRKETSTIEVRHPLQLLHLACPKEPGYPKVTRHDHCLQCSNLALQNLLKLNFRPNNRICIHPFIHSQSSIPDRDKVYQHRFQEQLQPHQLQATFKCCRHQKKFLFYFLARCKHWR